MANKTRRNQRKKARARARPTTKDFKYVKKALQAVEVPLPEVPAHAKAESEELRSRSHAFFKKLTYYDGYRFKWLMSNPGGLTWYLFADMATDNKDKLHILVDLERIVPNADDPKRKVIPVRGGSVLQRKLYPSESDEEWLFKCWKMIKEFEDHERDEFFQFDGSKVYDPHNPRFQVIAA